MKKYLSFAAGCMAAALMLPALAAPPSPSAPAPTPKPTQLPGPRPSVQPFPVSFTNWQMLQDSKIRDQTSLLLRNADDWQKFWARHAGPGQTAPAVDFAKEWVIAVILGERPTQGYTACVEKIVDNTQGLLHVWLQEKHPPEDMFLPFRPVSPGCLVRIGHQAPDTHIRFTYDRIPQRTALPMRTLSQISNSLILTPRFVVAQDAESFSQLWEEHTGRPESQPPVDFSKEMVVAAFMGEQPSGGYSVSIKEVLEGDGTLTVKTEKSNPSPEQLVIQMLTAPAHMIAIPRRDLPIVFE